MENEHKDGCCTVTETRVDGQGGYLNKEIEANPPSIDYEAVAKELRSVIWLYAPTDLTLNDAGKILDRMMSSFIGGTGG